MRGEYRTIELVLASVSLLLITLGWLSRKYPQVTWLRGFNLQAHLTDEQRKRAQRTANLTAGAQLILLGVLLPLGFFLLKVMLFSSISTMEIALVAAGSLLCIVLGVAAMVRLR